MLNRKHSRVVSLGFSYDELQPIDSFSSLLSDSWLSCQWQPVIVEDNMFSFLSALIENSSRLLVDVSFLFLECCRTSARLCGQTGSGSLKATAGPTWPTAMAKFTPNCRICGFLYPSLSASCLSGKYLRGELRAALGLLLCIILFGKCVFVFSGR